MVNKCANPACSATFRSLRAGKLFVKAVEDHSYSNGSGRSRQLHYLWLCSSCCRTMTVVADKGKGITIAPLPASATSVQAAS